MTVTTILSGTSAAVQTWAVPGNCANGTVVTVDIWGAGSGGSGGSTSFRSGGAGGAWATTPYTITAADVANGIPYMLTGGAAGTGAADGNAGPDTVWQYSKDTIRNPSMRGAVVGRIGSGGALPDNWTLWVSSGTFAASGLTCDVAGFGSDDGSGTPYIDLTFGGTPIAAVTALSIATASLGVTVYNGEPCTANTGYAFSSYLSYTGSAPTGISGGSTQINCYTSAFAYDNNPTRTGNAFTLSTSRTRNTTTFTTNATAVFTTPSWTWTVANPTAVAFTIRIAGPQLEVGGSATAWADTLSTMAWAKGGSPPTGTTGGVGGSVNGCWPISGAFAGGNGATRTQGGGGGGSAGPDGAGGSSTSGTGGTGDNTLGGAHHADNILGGGGGSAGNPGETGGNPGAGGGANTSTITGYAGGRGQIRLTYGETQLHNLNTPQLQPLLAQ